MIARRKIGDDRDDSAKEDRRSGDKKHRAYR